MPIMRGWRQRTAPGARNEASTWNWLSHPIRELNGRHVRCRRLGRIKPRRGAHGRSLGMRDRHRQPPRRESQDLMRVELEQATGHVGHRFTALPPERLDPQPDRRNASLALNESGRAADQYGPRGALVDGRALAAALKAGRARRRADSMFCRKSRRRDDDPCLDPAIPNLIVTPQAAWAAAREARQRCLDEMAANIRDFATGGRRSRVV